MATPTNLYRIFDQTSVSTFDPMEGFRSLDQDFTTDDWSNSEKMRLALTQHLDWYNRIPTPFISISAARDATRREALRRHSRGRKVQIAEISSWKLEAEQVKWDQVSRLVNRHGATDAPFVGTAEYLCLNCIPASAVKKLWDWEEFER